MDEEPLFVEDDTSGEVVDLTSSQCVSEAGANHSDVEELFVEPPEGNTTSTNVPTNGIETEENTSHFISSENIASEYRNITPQTVVNAESAAPIVPGQPVVDRIKLASLLKTLDSQNDAVFRDQPNYMRDIIKEMLENDFLLVLGKGLGLAQVLRMFLAKVRQIAKNALILVLGSRPEDETYSEGSDEIMSSSKPNKTDRDSEKEPSSDGEEPITVGFGISASKRSKYYASGGTYLITGPIAVVDILSGVLDCTCVSGIVVTHAETVHADSTLAFAIRLLKQRHPSAFIKALCDAPERLIVPPSLPLKLRVLGVPTLMLWPRFHLSIDRALPKLTVDEVIVEQNIAVRRQQALLSEMMQAVISDIKRRVPHLDVDYLAPELGPQQQSNPDRLHASMGVDNLLASSDFPYRVRKALRGVWHQLSSDGRNSVYSLSTLQQLQRTLTVFDAKTFYLQLELARKDTSQPWAEMAVVPALLGEARRSAALKRMPGKFYHVRDLLTNFEPQSRVLILCDSSKTVVDLHSYLNRPDEENASDEKALREMEAEMQRKDEEEQLLKEAEAAASVNAGRPGRRRVRGGSTVASNTSIKREIDKEPGSNSAEISASIEVNSGHKREHYEIDLTTDSSRDTGLDGDCIKNVFHNIEVTIATYRGRVSLTAISPDHVVMFDPNLYFTREVERYAASRIKLDGSYNLEVHFMYYQQSAEELQYLTAMRREKDAFSRLIREKGIMPMHLQDGEPEGGSDPKTPSLLLSSSRRQYQLNKAQPRVVVDVREFRSALPFHIWQARMDVIPLTLLVGDYILTPDIVVERKSVNDLIGSFRDGRLYQQCEAMLKYYKIACLLIEFDNKSYFTMEPFRDIRTRTADVQREIQENLSTLMLRFPKLRLLWSSSPMHSAQIFQSLKDLEAEPDPDECAKAGQSMLMDSAALSMLEKMPGLTPRTAPLIAMKVSNMVELVNMSQEKLGQILGSGSGDTLWRFLNNER